jgi:hypothetical protein
VPGLSETGLETPAIRNSRRRRRRRRRKRRRGGGEDGATS